MSSLEQLYCEYRQELFQYALGLTGHAQDAEDAIQATFQKLLSGNSLDRVRDLKPYVFRCLRHVIIDHYRHYQERVTLFEDPPALSDESAPPPSGMSLAAEDLNQLLERLSPREREILILKAMNGLTFREIAEVQDQSQHSIASTYRRALEKLRSRLKTLTLDLTCHE